jgi:type II secretory pathway pseudopilin PulG
MRSVQTAIEAYAIDHGRYPAAHSMAEMKDLVQPTYIKTTPLADAWGTEFRYVPTPDGKSYQLVSAGSDKTFDESSWTTPGLLETSKEDAVVSSGAVEREWVIQK